MIFHDLDVYLMHHKSKAFEKFKKFRHEVEKEIEKPLKALRSDRRGEYLSEKLLKYLKKYGIISQWTLLEYLNSMGF